MVPSDYRAHHHWSRSAARPDPERYYHSLPVAMSPSGSPHRHYEYDGDDDDGSAAHGDDDADAGADGDDDGTDSVPLAGRDCWWTCCR